MPNSKRANNKPNINFLDENFEEQVVEAIKFADFKMLQVLLGYKYCQLWQYWLVHCVIASKTLEMQKIAASRVLSKVSDKQLEILKEQKLLLEERKTFLQSNPSKDAKNSNQDNKIKKSRVLITDLLSAIVDSLASCRKEMASLVEIELKQDSNYDEYYMLTQEPSENKPVLPVVNNSSENNGALAAANNNPSENVVKLKENKEFSLTREKIPTIAAVEKLSFIAEIDELISELSDKIKNAPWKDSNKSTKSSYYVGKASDWEGVTFGTFDNKDDERLKKFANLILNTLGTPLKVSGKGIIIVLRYLPRVALAAIQQCNDNINSLSCIAKNLDEVNKLIKVAEDQQGKAYTLSDQLTESNHKIKADIMAKMNDQKFIDKEFVKQMYVAFLHDYLGKICTDQSHLLYGELKKSNFVIEEVVERILETVETKVEYRKFGNFIERVIGGENKSQGKKDEDLTQSDFNMISVLIANSAPLTTYSRNALPKFVTKSYQTLLMDVHNLLFDFKGHSPHVNININLLSYMPNRIGQYTENCKDSLMLLGNKKYEVLLNEVKKFTDNIEKLVAEGKLNRSRTKLAVIGHWLWDFFCDFFQKTANTEEERQEIDAKIREFIVTANHMIATKNEGMFKDYQNELKKRMLEEKNSDVRELYRIISSDGIFQSSTTPPTGHTISEFVQSTHDRIEAIKKVLAELEQRERDAQNAILEQEKAVVVQERDQIAEEKAQVVEERDQIAEEKAQVVEERDQIAEEKAQVVEERDQIAKRAELRDCIRKKLFRVLRREFSDNELLADIIEDKQDVIVDAAVKVSLAHSEHAPEKVVDALIEQVKSNGQRIVLEEGIAEDIINDGVSSFLTAVTVKPALSTTPKID